MSDATKQLPADYPVGSCSVEGHPAKEAISGPMQSSTAITIPPINTIRLKMCLVLCSGAFRVSMKTKPAKPIEPRAKTAGRVTSSALTWFPRSSASERLSRTRPMATKIHIQCSCDCVPVFAPVVSRAFPQMGQNLLLSAIYIKPMHQMTISAVRVTSVSIVMP